MNIHPRTSANLRSKKHQKLPQAKKPQPKTIGDQLRLILPISGGRSSNLPKRLLLSSIVPMGSGHPSIVPTGGGRPSIVPTGWGRPSILPTGWGRPSIVPTDCHQGLAATAAGPAGGPSQPGWALGAPASIAIYRGKGEGEVRYRRGKYGGSEGEVHPAAAEGGGSAGGSHFPPRGKCPLRQRGLLIEIMGK